MIGSRLEELLHGFLDAMGAQDLIWRAGSTAAVTTADGGRDLEAVFASPSPDGSVELVRWWVEAKGRAKTIKKNDVVDSVSAMTARPDVDVFVFATNSRFSNPTRDWVADWQRSHPRPKVRLWDRDDLARFVRQFPLVTARILPESLDDADRVMLLSERFERLGEGPTHRDLSYFWAHQQVFSELEMTDLVEVIAMLAHAETDHGLVDRPWASLLPKEVPSNIHVAVYALAILPRMAMRERARPIDSERLAQTCAYLLLSVMGSIDAKVLHTILANPTDFLTGFEAVSGNPKAVKAFAEAIVLPIWSRVHNELMDVCGDDCRRVLGEPGAAFPQPLVGERYWRRFGVGDPPDERRLIIESTEAPCTVGLDLDGDHMCPLGRDPEITLERVQELCRIVTFRRTTPGNHAYAGVKLPEVLEELRNF